MIMRTSAELKQFLYGQGAGLVGIGNMEGIENCRFQTGVAIAVPLPPRAVAALREAPTLEYLDLYHALNQKLDEIVLAGERFLQNAGHNALAQTTARVKADGDNISPLPHKTVATRAGLGWIGKSGLLVTPQYGGAIRLSSLLTDAELDYDEPVVRSRCGTGGLCVEQCPAGALRGALWEAGMERKQIVDVEACRKKQVEIMSRRTGIETDLCGKCFAVCAYTRRYLNGSGREE